MNNARRKELNRIATNIETYCIPTDMSGMPLIDDIKSDMEDFRSDIDMVFMDEQMAFDSMPENLQYSIRGEASQEAQDNMEEAIDALDSIIDDLDIAVDEADREIEDLKEDDEEYDPAEILMDKVNEILELENVVDYLMSAAM